MSDSGENKYKWTPESTTLLVSVWTDRQVQKQLEYSTKPQLIWESVAKYMNKKGYNVNGKQCRSRMKQVLVCYREAKRAGTKAGVEQYYESIDRVLKHKRLEHCNNNNNNNGIDTVDSTANLKSPPKDVKTNKNLQMRYKYQQPPESVFRTEALSPLWNGREEDYPDSPESNETVLAKPFRVLSPVRDAATNTSQHQLGNMNKKISQNGICEEIPIKENYRQNTYSNNYFSEIPFQNAVQNVQNQIIQENMQQNQATFQQNLLQNQLLEQNQLQMNPILRHNSQSMNQPLYNDQNIHYNHGKLPLGQNMIAENILRMQNKYQQNSVNNQAVPQEPRKTNFRQNLTTTYQQFQNAGTQNYNANMNHLGLLSPSISPDIPPNLNDAFCQSKNEKIQQGLNEFFTRPSSNQLTNADVTAITNNATFNDDSLSIEFLQDSPSPDNQPTKLKDFAVNTDDIPNAPVRKKKAEKLERLMMNAINSQTEVVNKILAAQNDMVTRVLDLDRDRQNRLENRLDHLIDVVQNAVLNKSQEKESEIPPPLPEPLITNLMPPPKPGVIPPKLDLVPPKPCRVPCTVSNSNPQPINQNPYMTRPGVVSPIVSPSRKVGAIWQKLGPVSTSPFVRAQQQLGFRPTHAKNEVRTKSSAERRIAKDFEIDMDTKALIFETENFLEAERQIQEEVENARIKASMGQELQTRRRLFTQREPNAAMILSAAFLEAEIQSTEINENARLNWLRQKQYQDQKELLNQPIHTYKYEDYRSNNVIKKRGDENIFAGQGDCYDRLRQLNINEKIIGNPCESSTPVKGPISVSKHNNDQVNEPRQTIQQLAQLVMNSARWRNNAANNLENQRIIQKPACPEEHALDLRSNAKEITVNKPIPYEAKSVDGKAKALNWLQDRYSYGGQTVSNYNDVVNQEITNRRSYNEPTRPTSMGFTSEFLKNEDNNNNNNVVNRRHNEGEREKRVAFVFDNDVAVDENKKHHFNRAEKDPFEELHQFYIQKQFKLQQNQGLPLIVHNGKVIVGQNDMIEHYVQEAFTRNKQNRDTDSDNDEEFLDTTTSLHSSRKNSLTSIGTKTSKSELGCIIS